MRYMRLPLFLFMALLPTLGVVALPAKAPAIDGSCGGAVPCDCGDRVLASRTLILGVDPITTKICDEGGLLFFVAENLTLDLGGNTLRGSCPGEREIGIEINRSSRIIVRNGRIIGFDIGIEGNGVADTLVSLVQVLDSCNTGISFSLIGVNRIEGCIVRNTTGTVKDVGLIGGDGIVVDGETNTVHLCRAESNAGQGLAVHGTGNTVTRNIVLHSGSDGVVIGGSGATVMQNQSNYSDTGEGFKIEGAGHVVSRNIAISNAEDGLTVSATGSTFDRNRSNSNGGFGILDTSTGDGTSGTANTYTDNVCTGNDLGDSDPLDLCR